MSEQRNDSSRCDIEGCLCQSTTQPITEAVYGKKPRSRGNAEYEPHTGARPIYERLPVMDFAAILKRYPKLARSLERKSR